MIAGSPRKVRFDDIRLRTVSEKIKSFLFGDDVFISYARGNSTNYGDRSGESFGERDFFAFLISS